MIPVAITALACLGALTLLVLIFVAGLWVHEWITMALAAQVIMIEPNHCPCCDQPKAVRS